MHMLLCKFLVTPLLLVALQCGATGVLGSVLPLPQEEVNVVNILFQRLKTQPWELDRYFSAYDCGVKLENEITCDCTLENHTICRVTIIDLSSHDLGGRIPAEIGNLTHLRVLDLSENKLQGSIPKSFGNLSQLRSLYLSDNYLEGPMPPCLGELKSLRAIDLSNNWFKDSIPSALGALPSLRFLNLESNVLSGPIPYELGNAASLQILILLNNRLSGQLPHQLGKLKNMTSMYLGNNEFTGELPSSFKELKKLLTFGIRGNNFRGPIPKYIANWEHLQQLQLIGNNFEGSLPTVITLLINLTYLAVNDLTASPRGGRDFTLPNVSNMTSLKTLSLRNCSLTGPIPDFIWRLPSLSYLDLSFNNLTGGIPNVVNQQFRKVIFLKGNNLTGSLPGWLTSLNDSYVDVSENVFTNAAVTPGNISKNLNLFLCCSNVTTMPAKWQESQEVYHNCNKALNDHLYINCGGEQVSIDDNNYEADLQPDGGSTFFLSGNKSWAYSSMGTFLGADRNNYIVQKTCNISMVDAPLYKTARVSPISLKYYGFCLKNDVYIVKLHFAEIAWELMKNTSSKGKRVFDVEIQGRKRLSNFNIEAEAEGLNKDKTKEYNVPVNDNRLEIHLYWTGKGSTSDTIKYYGPLISAISVSPVPRNKASSRLSVVHIAGIVGSLLLFFIFILGVLWKLGCFGVKKLHDEELSRIELFPGGVFNFRQIKAATQNFSTANKLGEGGFGTVYKGIIPKGPIIAVKQLSTRSKQGIREFVNEISTISALQHPHLVRLMGCCAEDNQLLLVYEYMEKNSLAHALFGSEELKLELNWPTRVKICLGIAKGLAFLHEESKLKIVHRDIKPTNILLDEHYNAKISDFGFAKLYEEEKTHVITRIAGTTGYMAPEYAMRGYLTDKADVYSFGVVTLEIISGKNNATSRPNDQSVYLLDLAYVLQKEGNLIQLVDQALRSDFSRKEAITILDLAMMCTNPSPTLRPTMSEVVKIIEGKTKIISSKINAPYPMDEFTTAKAIAALSQSSQSGSTSQEGASNTTLSHSASKEIEESTLSADYATEMNNGQQGILATETS